MAGRWEKSVPGKIKPSANSCGPLVGLESDFLGRGTGDRNFAGVSKSPSCLHLLKSSFSV